MTRAEVKELLGEPEWDNDNYMEWLVSVSDSDYEGNFSIYFTDSAENAVVTQADLDIREQ